MTKICKSCNSPFKEGNSHFGLCKHCNTRRLIDVKLNKKKITSTYPVKVVRVYSIPKPTATPTVNVATTRLKNKHVNSYGVKNLKEFFAKIWSDRQHICTHCNKNLGSEPKTHYFSHIYPKSLKPWLKFDVNNIELLCVDCHTAHDFGKRKNSLR